MLIQKSMLWKINESIEYAIQEVNITPSNLPLQIQHLIQTLTLSAMKFQLDPQAC